MSEKETSRRKFLQFLGLSAGTTLLGSKAFGGFVDKEEIKKLNPVQQEFMIRYGNWMDEFIEVVRIQKADPDNLENQKKMIALTEKVEKLQPELDEFMKDKTFSLIYQASIQRLTKEI